MSDNIFVVPHDFTDASDNALKYALNICKQNQSSIAIVHITSKESENEASELKLKTIIEKNTNSFITIKSYVVNGSIFTDIGKIAEELNANAIIMGTHGSIGMQKVFGSFAMKVIISTHVPFMVVQENTQIRKIKNIVLSLNTSLESLQITSLVGKLAKLYHSKIHIIAEKNNDPHYTMKIKSNLKAVAKHLNDIDIDYELEIIDIENSWLDTIINYAKNIDADMFALSYDSDRFFAANDKFTQSLLFNELNISTLIINSKKFTHVNF